MADLSLCEHVEIVLICSAIEQWQVEPCRYSLIVTHGQSFTVEHYAALFPDDLKSEKRLGQYLAVASEDWRSPAFITQFTAWFDETAKL